MGSPKTRRVLLIALAELAVVFAFLTVTELACRYLEQIKIEHQLPEKLRRPLPKSDSEFRVFAFGGSTVYGLPVPEVGFVAQVQYWLQRLYPDRKIRVYNFGWPAMTTSEVLREMTRRFEDQPDLMIVITGHNEFMWWTPETQGQIARIRDALFSHFATIRLLQWAVGRIMKFRQSNVMPCQVQPRDRESASFKSRIATFEKGINLIVERASHRGINLIVGTLPSNLSDWPPVYKRLANRDQHYSDVVSRIQELLRDGKHREALDAVTAGFSVYPEDAMLYFLRGQIQSALGSYADAWESFVKARDLDPIPWRTSSQINSIIRRVASGVAGVYLLDLEKVYEEHSKRGLIGFDLIADNVHGTPLGESLTAQIIIQKMIDIGFLPASSKAEAECCPVSTFLGDVGYLEPKSRLRLRALLHNGTYSMKTPFLNYEASRMYLLEDLKVDEDSWQVWANLATVSLLTGDTAAGKNQLQRATELHHGSLDVNDRKATPYLKEALAYAAGRKSDCGDSR